MNLLRGHRLGFDNRARFLFANDAENDIARLLRRAGPMHPRPTRFNFFDEFEKIFIQMIDGFPFGLRCRLSRGLPILERSFGFIANDLIFSKRCLDDLAMAQIARQPRCLLLELFGETFHDCARTSAKWIVLTLLLCRESRPCTCMRQLESLETM